MIGGAGQFRQTNVEKVKNKPLNLQQWFLKSQHKNFAGPGPKDLDRTLDRDSEQARAQRAAEEEARQAAKMAKKAKKEESERLKRLKRESEAIKAEVDADVEDIDAVHAKDGVDEAEDEEAPDQADHDEGMVDGEPVPPLDPSSAISPPSSSDPLATTPEPEPIPQWFETFKPTEDWLPQGTRVDDYTPEACATMERKFWKNIGLGEPSWYGADLQGE